jgi:peptidoglycan/xylan/chitin deacetylase (PgdA/CDA1 family)
MWPELAGAAVGISGFMLYAVAAPFSQIFGPAVSQVPNARGSVALTFDDGPSESTPALLDVLARHRARATFFMCGANVLRLPQVARRATVEGHEVANHTFRHPYLYKTTSRRMDSEIAETQEAIESAVGCRPALFRPPFGVRWFGLYPVLRRHHLTAVMWSACVYDWSRPAEAIARGLLAKTAEGKIVLMHDGDQVAPGDRRSATVRALDQALPALAARGLRFVTVSELMRAGYQRKDAANAERAG